MNDHSKSSSSGFSPNISAVLSIHGHQFAVASVGPGFVKVRQSFRVEPGRGTIRMMIDSKATVYHVELLQGINPDLIDQPFRLITSREESAA
jgi:hypothetical protein